MPSARCVVLETFGQPVRIHELAVPSLQPGAAVAEVEFGGVCGTDVHLQAGRLAIPLPLVLGHEGGASTASLARSTTLRI